MYPSTSPGVASNAPAEGVVSLAATSCPSGSNDAFMVERTRAVGGIKLFHFRALTSLKFSTVKPLASMVRAWNEAVCPGRRVISEGTIWIDLAGPAAGH